MPLDTLSSSRTLRSLLAVLIVTFNLRGAITCVGPLLDTIQTEFGLSSTAAGFLTSLPLFAFGFVSPYAAPLARRLGMELAILASLVLLLGGLVLRYLPSVVLLYLGTACIGIAIAIGNVLLPGLLRRDHHQHLTLVTALFTMVLVIVGGLGSGLSIPLYELGGWRFSLAAWALPVVASIALWLPELRHNTRTAQTPAPTPKISLWRSPLAWQVALLMGCQSSAFYVLIAWFPSLMLETQGVSAARSGWILFVYQIFILISVMAVPPLIQRLADQRWIGAGCGALALSGYLGLYLAPAQAMTWMLLLGLGGGGALVLTLTLFGLRTQTTTQTVALSGMAQAVGYLMAALLPIVIGFVHDLCGNWNLSLLLMLVICTGQMVMGYLSGLPRTIEAS
ncbi:MAG: MFS transporter [Pseudomonadales bacterium]|jgi:CP family cyanate transporter-like MFS transporter|nr:MFS transporter [Pseudomonadales bacterium]